MKKVISFMLSLLMLVSISAGISFTVSADSSGDFEYFVLDDGTAAVSAYSGLQKNVVIPSEIDGHKVSEVYNWCFQDSDITGVVIPEGVTVIGMNAFMACYSLKNIVLPKSLEVIKSSAFGSCYSLESITVPNGVKEISKWAFSSCKLKNIVLPESVELVGTEAFRGCEDLEYAVVLNPDCEFVDESAFTADLGEEVGPLSNFNIYGYENSSAQKLAQKWGYDFRTLNNLLLEGTETQYSVGAAVGAKIHCLYDLADFISVAMDGETVDPTNYTLAEGSTLLTFKPAYLDTLSVGDHTVTLNYTNATVTSVLTIKESSDEPTDVPEEPTTDKGDQSTNTTEPDKTTGSDNAAGAADASASSAASKSPHTGTSYAGIAAAACAAVLSAAAVTLLKKKKCSD